MNPFATLAPMALVALVGCANRPESIHASFVSYEKFVDLDCAALDARMSDARADLVKFSRLQDDKANGDAVGVFLLGIPFSKLSGDHEADVARAKGEIDAIETAQIKNKCRGLPSIQAAPGAPASSASADAGGGHE